MDPKQGRPLKGRWHYLRQNIGMGYEEKEDRQAEEHVESADAREGPNGATGTWGIMKNQAQSTRVKATGAP